MNETKNTQATGGCDRGEQLVAYLYGESDQQASQEFQTHLAACAACREELSAFGGVRASVALWRNSILEASEAPSLSETFAPAALHNDASAPRKRSALAALRAFFDLSPLWLKAATTAAALVLCFLAVRAFTNDERVVTQVVTKTVEVPAPPSEEQVNALVAQRVELRLAEIEKQTKPEPAPVVNASVPPRSKPRGELAQASAVRRKQSAPNVARRNELFREEAENLPRLSDLLSGSY